MRNRVTILFFLRNSAVLLFIGTFLCLTGGVVCAQDTPADSMMVDSATAMAPPPAPAPRPVSNVTAADTPGDKGGSITVRWDLSPDDHAGDPQVNLISGYEIFRGESAAGPFASVGFMPAEARRFEDETTDDHKSYFYKVAAVGTSGGSSESAIAGPAHSSLQWFDTHRTNLAVVAVILSFAVIFYIARARRGRKIFIRPIAGLEAIHDAIGRATEMGRPILYIPGIQDMDDVQTVAGVTILGYVARTIAEYDTKIDVPTSRSIVMSTARETIKAAYMAAGRPDAYSDDAVHYVTDEQFGYVAAVDGIMVRDKPATCFYLGSFFAESLIMAETGNSIGAIQIAGTAQPAQLPFFVAACDYTLIGEELFAASAYLSNEPKQLGSLKGQDVGKMIAMLAILLGVVFFTLGQITGVDWFSTAGHWVQDLFLLN